MGKISISRSNCSFDENVIGQLSLEVVLSRGVVPAFDFNWAVGVEMEVEARLEAFLEENEIILIPAEVRSKLTQSFDAFNASVKSLRREYDDFKVLKGKG